jgi:hypothetical protein
MLWILENNWPPISTLSGMRVPVPKHPASERLRGQSLHDCVQGSILQNFISAEKFLWQFFILHRITEKISSKIDMRYLKFM